MKKTIRVFLRALEPEDYKLSVQWRQDDDLWFYYGGHRLYVSSANEKKWVEDRIFDKENASLAICIKETGEYIGNTFLTDVDYINRSGHCPAFIGAKEHWGKGYGTDARILILKHAFHDRGLQRIWGRVIEGNTRSLRMAEKCGYKMEGTLRKSLFRNGMFYNEHVLSVLREDFEEVLKEYEL